MEQLNVLLARLQGQRVYLDTNCLIYFFDRTSMHFEVMVQIIQACDRGEFFGLTGDAAVAEFMVHPYRTHNAGEIARAKSFFTRKNFLTVLAHTGEIFDVASQLRANHTVKLIDALQFATAAQAQCRFLITNDTGFGSLSSPNGLEVIILSEISSPAHP